MINIKNLKSFLIYSLTKRFYILEIRTLTISQFTFNYTLIISFFFYETSLFFLLFKYIIIEIYVVCNLNINKIIGGFLKGESLYYSGRLLLYRPFFY